MKKLLMVTQNYHPSKGGMAESCTRIVKNLRKKGIEVSVLHFTNRVKPYLIKNETNGKYVALGIFDSEEYTLNLANLFLERNSDKLDFDAIIAFGGYLPMMWTPILSKLFDKSLFTCIRGNDFDEGLFSKKREVLFYALENSKGILSVTEEKRQKIAKLFPKNESFYTPNGINSSFWSINQQEQIEALEKKKNLTDKKVILIAGQLKFKKGLSYFVESFSQFPFNKEYELWLVGDISTAVQNFVAGFQINVRHFPFVLKHEMKLYYEIADLVCIPSFYDGMPNVLLEAGAVKNVILASDVGGISDVIVNKKSGLLYSPLEQNALLDTLIQFHYLKENEKENLKNNLYETVSKNYTEENEILKYIDILKN